MPSSPQPSARFSWLHRMFQEPATRSYQITHLILNMVICGAVLLGALETVDSIHTRFAVQMDRIELIIVGIFTLDYIANIITAPSRSRYLLSFWGVIDLMSIAPSILMLGNITALKSIRMLRVLRVMRVLRVLKLARQAVERVRNSQPGTKMLGLNLLIYCLAFFSLMVICSSLEYYAEYTNGQVDAVSKVSDKTLRFRAADLYGDLRGEKVIIEGSPRFSGTYQVQAWDVPNHTFDVAVGDNTDVLKEATFKFTAIDRGSQGTVRWIKDTPFCSVPQAMWWCVVTLTTVGYGDMVPATVWGRIVAGCTMFCGLVLFGMLMNIVGKTMMLLLFGVPHLDHDQGAQDSTDNAPAKLDSDWHYCPTCGKPVGDTHGTDETDGAHPEPGRGRRPVSV